MRSIDLLMRRESILEQGKGRSEESRIDVRRSMILRSMGESISEGIDTSYILLYYIATYTEMPCDMLAVHKLGRCQL